jgi:hypothetical protein
LVTPDAGAVTGKARRAATLGVEVMTYHDFKHAISDQTLS